MKKVISIFIVFMVWANVSMAASILVTWNPNSETDLAGYDIYDAIGTGTATKVGSVGVMASPSFTILNVVDGLHTVTLTAFDTSGNISLPSTPVSATVDTIPPNKPAKPVAVVTTSSVKLTWTASTEADLYGYGIYDNNILIGTIGVMASPTYTATNLINGSHSFVIDSVDIAGNRSVKSDATVVIIDTTPPTKPGTVKIQINK